MLCCGQGHTSHSKFNSRRAEWRDLCNKADLILLHDDDDDEYAFVFKHGLLFHNEDHLLGKERKTFKQACHRNILDIASHV